MINITINPSVTKNIITKLNGQVVDYLDENTDVGNYKIYFTAIDVSGNLNDQSVYNVDILVYDNTAPVVPLKFNLKQSVFLQY